MFCRESSQMCQSRYFKEWHPDYIANYNSLNDKHLKHYFKHPARVNHLNRNHKISPNGDVISEKEWRKQNLEWEKRRREAEDHGNRTHQRDVDERRAKMVLRQKQKDEDSKKRKEENGHPPKSGVKEAWADQSALLDKISESNKNDVEQLLSFLNFEIECILRPKSAPMRYRNPLVPMLRTDRRAQSARGRNSRTSVRPSSNASMARAKSSEGRYLLETPESVQDCGTPKRKYIRNIEIPHTDLSPSNRPATAPGLRRHKRPKSPSHPYYKEESYLLSQVHLQYVGHYDHKMRTESRARHRAHRKRKRLPLLPSHVDEVTIVQQPRGSYVLEVFHGYLAVGDHFQFTSRRVEGYPFSLTIYVNRQCHVRLSTCCESKRTVGGRLGQGCFQLLKMEGNIPCIRCMLEKDPVAQKHAARIKQLRGSYDRYGNRIPPSFFKDKRTKRWKKRPSSLEKDLLESDEEEEPGYQEQATSRPNPPRRIRSSRRVYKPNVSAPNSSVQSKFDPTGSNANSSRSSRPKSASKYNQTNSNIKDRPTASTSRSSPVQELEEYTSVDEESSEADIPLPEVDEEEVSSSMTTSDEEASESEEVKFQIGSQRQRQKQSSKKAEKSRSPVTRTMLKVEVKHKLEESYKEGLDASEHLINADRELEQGQSESEENDTINEAPSIEDEVLSKSDEESSSQESHCSNKWSTAENVKVLINVNNKLQEATREGKEVSGIILEAQQIMDKMEMEEEKKVKRFNFIKKMSQFQAMALIGKLFFGARHTKVDTKADTIEEETDESDTATEETGDDPERAIDQVKAGNDQIIQDSTPSNPVEMNNRASTKIGSEMECSEGAEDQGITSSSSDEDSEASEEEEEPVKECLKHTTKSSPIQIQIEKQASLPEEAETTPNVPSSGSSSPNTLQVPKSSTEEVEALPEFTMQKVIDTSSGKPEVTLKHLLDPKSISHFQALILLQRIFAAESSALIEGEDRKTLSPRTSDESESESSDDESEGEDDLTSLSESKDESKSESGSESAEDSPSKESSLGEDQAKNNDMQKEGQGVIREDLDEAREQSMAATKIQSNFRGMQARKNVEEIRKGHRILAEEEEEGATSESESSSDESSGSSESSSSSKEEASKGEEKHQVGKTVPQKPLNEEKAVTVIQSGYRGTKARRRVKKMRQERDEAVVKIQSGYRGMKARRRVSEIKEDKAVVKIQSGYRGMKARRRVDNMRQSNRIDPQKYSDEEAVTKIQSGYRGMKARRRVQKMKQDKRRRHLEIKAMPEEEFEEKDENIQAATKIQAGYRGMKARKKVGTLKKGQIEEEESESSDSDSDSDDEDTESTEEEHGNSEEGESRRSVNEENIHAQESTELDEKKMKADPDLADFTFDDDMEDAAVKIQANFKGMKTRKDLQVMQHTKHHHPHVEEKGCESNSKEIANYDSTNDFTEDSDSDSSSDESSVESAVASSVDTNESILVKNVLLQEYPESNDYDSGTSMSNQNTPRNSIGTGSPVPTPVIAHVLQVEPVQPVDTKEVPNSSQEPEGQSASQSSDSETCRNEDEQSEQNHEMETSKDDNEDSSSMSDESESSTTTNSSFSRQIRPRKSPFSLLKQLVSIIQIPAKVQRNNRIGIGNGIPKPADVTKSKPLFLPGESMDSNEGKSNATSGKSSRRSSEDEEEQSEEESAEEDRSDLEEEQA